ncbi:hypothetical protein [Bifidobacterium moukalabense]|uniref:hypothetical protein n=1 Tax=Bifidobacterium moukalabense TaxID=1333651 RepID=UPI0010F53197|nr:hypothetical protein [Bifidobacterium moukalabense]
MKYGTSSRRYTHFFIIIVALSDNLFGLLNADSINIKGIFNLDIVWQMLASGFAIYIYWKNSKNGRIILNWMNVCILLLLASCFVAALQCTLITGQPFIRGILPQRTFIVALLCAFLLQGLVASKLIDINQIIDMFVVIGTVVGVAYLFQAVSGVQIFHVLQNERYGSARLYMQSCFPDMAGFIGFWRLLETGRIKYAFPAFLTIILSLFVSKGRLELIALLVTYFLVMLVVRRKADIKFYLISFFSLCVVLFISSSYGERLLANFNSSSVESDTTSIRRQGRLLYSTQLQESVVNRIFGCGYPNVLYSPAAHRAGLDEGIILGDNGIFAFIYVHGFLGLIAIVSIVLLVLRFALLNIKSEAGLFCFTFLSFSLVACSNITWWWFSGAWPMTFALVICCAQTEVSLDNEFLSHKKLK